MDDPAAAVAVYREQFDAETQEDWEGVYAFLEDVVETLDDAVQSRSDRIRYAFDREATNAAVVSGFGPTAPIYGYLSQTYLPEALNSSATPEDAMFVLTTAAAIATGATAFVTGEEVLSRYRDVTAIEHERDYHRAVMDEIWEQELDEQESLYQQEQHAYVPSVEATADDD